MATRRRFTTRYDSYGSVAYAPVYEGNAVRAPRREEEYQPSPQPRRREQTHRRAVERTQVEVRQAGAVAPFAVVGFLAVAIFAALLLVSHAQSTVLNAEVVELRSQLSALETEHAKLSAQYEQVFDMEKIQAAVGDTMVRPTNSQAVYLDLSEPDTVVGYDNLKNNKLFSAIAGAGETLGELIEYFR
jgi:hypothetical protein